MCAQAGNISAAKLDLLPGFVFIILSTCVFFAIRMYVMYQCRPLLNFHISRNSINSVMSFCTFFHFEFVVFPVILFLLLCAYLLMANVSYLRCHNIVYCDDHIAYTHCLVIRVLAF